MFFKASRSVLCIFAVLGFSGPSYADSAADFRAATSVAEVADLGAQRMAGVSIQNIFSDHTLENPGWTWSFTSSGVQTSQANDGSWSDEGTWDVANDQFCRQSVMSEGKRLCSNVYFLGRDLKFSDPDAPNGLKEWFVRY